MKKLLFLATGLITLASCSENDFVGDEAVVKSQQEEGMITFSTSSQNITRADKVGAEAAGMLNKHFTVGGFKGDGTAYTTSNPPTGTVFDNYNVTWQANTAATTESNTSDWEYVGNRFLPISTLYVSGDANNKQSIKYWDYTASQYDFVAYSVGKATLTNSTPSTGELKVSAIDATKMNGVKPQDVITDGAYTIEGAADDLKKAYIADLVTVYRDRENQDDGLGDYQKVVKLKFRSLSAKVRIALYETIPGYSVKDVVFYTNANTKDDGTGAQAHLYTTGTDAFNGSGKYIVYFPTTGSGKQDNPDYNKAHLQFNADANGAPSTELALGALDNFAGKDVAETEATVYLGRSSNKATFAGTNAPYYTVVLPNEAGAVLNLKVDYTLLSTDGSGETIKVTGATAQVPAVYAAWKSGYAYTYLFKISDNTNGKTNPDLDPVGLYPITFDAVVTETEDGVQETITTVAELSITTYAEGKVVTSNNEYKVGTDIYISGVNTDGTTSNSVTLYSATLKSGSVSVISEETAKLAYDQGKTNYNTDNYDKTDVTLTQLYGASEVTTVPAVDGNTYTVNAIKFTPNDAGTYVARFETTENKVAYKVIVVAP